MCPALDMVDRRNEVTVDVARLAKRVRDTCYGCAQTAVHWDTAERKSW